MDRLLLIMLAILASMPPVHAADAGGLRRTGWSLAVGARIQWLSGPAHDELSPKVGLGGGVELRIAYGFTRRFSARIAATSNRHTTEGGAIRRAGVASAGVDVIVSQPLGAFDAHVFGRVGKQALHTRWKSPVVGDIGIADENRTRLGWMGGGGGGFRWWATRHMSLNAEALAARVRYTDSVADDDTGIPTPLGRTLNGTTWATVLSVEYHW